MQNIFAGIATWLGADSVGIAAIGSVSAPQKHSSCLGQGAGDLAGVIGFPANTRV